MFKSLNNKPKILLIVSLTITISLGLLLYAYNYSTKNDNSPQRYHFLHFGTSIQITTASNERILSNKVLNNIDQLLTKLHYKWHPWRDGELKNLNENLSSMQPFVTTAENIEIIKHCQKLHKSSLGYFNPAIGKLVKYWGFHKDNPNKNHNKTKINFKKLKHNIPNPSNIYIVNNTIQNNNPYLQLDLSGFIKADASLQIKKVLSDNNINNALINIGGDIYVIGNKEYKKHTDNKTPWTIATRTYDNNMIKLKIFDQEAIASSGIYARQYQKNNKLYNHIINPKTAKPSKGFYAVTVVHNDPYLADAAATALLIAGEKDYQKVATAMQVDKYILITDNSNLILSENIKDRII
jgi:thiamine biosynthesis lipoprotein